MEDKNKITAPKRKTAVSTSKKESVEEKASKSPVKKAAKKTKPANSSEDIPAAVEKPHRRKSIIKKEFADALAAKKGTPKETKKKTAEIEAKPEKKTRKAETAKQSEQSGITLTVKAFVELENILAAEIEAAPEVEIVAEKSEIIEESTASAEESSVEETPVFRELAAPKLPVLEPENRARLQMQSPTKLFFYWSLKSNPFETLRKVFGRRGGDYSLVVKLQNQTNETEQIFPVDSVGSTWFDVELDSAYRAEVGFSAARRPFIRLLFSNTVETPRPAPSPVLDWSPQFAVTPREFAEVLDASGYKRDAFEIALAGDDIETSNAKTFDVFEQLTGEQRFETKAAELRLALFALAAGLPLPDLREQISPSLFTLLEKSLAENAARLSAEKILSALEENFGFGGLETGDESKEIAYSVIGASRINFPKFPKQFWKRFAPVSSLRP